MVSDNEGGSVLVALAVGLLNDSGTVSGYILNTAIRDMARINNRIPCRNDIYATQCHQDDELGLKRVIRESPLQISNSLTALGHHNSTPLDNITITGAFGGK